MGSRVGVTLFVRNLLDATGATLVDDRSVAIFSTLAASYALEPRLFGVTLRYSFH